MKKISSMLIFCAFVFLMTIGAFAGNVTYSGDAGDFIFTPGSDYSETDLFTNFKDVMPGDSITQKILVKNEASNKVKVKIYMRSLGAYDDEMSQKFLSQLSLRLKKSEENSMAYMFDAAASESASLTDWVLLGTLYSGGEVNLDVTLTVPVSLENNYQKNIGFLDWQFMVEEFPIEDSDPKPPNAGEKIGSGIYMALGVAVCAAATLIIIPLARRKKKEN